MFIQEIFPPKAVRIKVTEDLLYHLLGQQARHNLKHVYCKVHLSVFAPVTL
jgi:hypothetical protein